MTKKILAALLVLSALTTVPAVMMTGTPTGGGYNGR